MNKYLVYLGRDKVWNPWSKKWEIVTDPWIRDPRPVPNADVWYETGKSYYTPEAIKAAREAGWTGSIRETEEGQVLV